jgi:hypothetical protein
MKNYTLAELSPRESTLEFLRFLARTYCPVQCDLEKNGQKLAY